MTHQDTDEDSQYHEITKPAFQKDPWDHDYYDFIDIVDGELVMKDDLSERPSDPPENSWFLAIDEKILYLYNGTSWEVIGGTDIQQSSDIDHDSTTGGTSGNPHADSASETYADSAADSAESSANQYTDGEINDHSNDENAHHSEDHQQRHHAGGPDALDAGDLSGAAGADEQVLTSDGTNASWEPAGGVSEEETKQMALAYDFVGV